MCVCVSWTKGWLNILKRQAEMTTKHFYKKPKPHEQTFAKRRLAGIAPQYFKHKFLQRLIQIFEKDLKYYGQKHYIGMGHALKYVNINKEQKIKCLWIRNKRRNIGNSFNLGVVYKHILSLDYSQKWNKFVCVNETQ